ncbi:MAG: hypothetical protein HFH91_02715 [Lachnospiraceae bacterium]|nr:hypothetical protein [Lachnospiraceae bacterium]
MTQIEINFVNNKLQAIIGARVAEVCRNHGDIWIDFMDELEVHYILLMQTLFRFYDNEKILITDTDKYRPSYGELKNPVFDEESFDWDNPGVNKFDEWNDTYSSMLKKLVVKEVNFNLFGDLTICFQNDVFLEVYLEVTNDEECWRFFEKEADDRGDIIVLGNTIIYDA